VDASKEFGVADGWWHLAEQTKDGSIKNAILLRSLFWYARAQPNLSGLKQTVAEKRIAELSPLAKKRPFSIDQASTASSGKPATTRTTSSSSTSLEPAKPGVRRKEAQGTLYACGDDQFELAVNSVALMKGSQKPVSTPLLLKVGDIISVKATNAQYEHGFLAFWLADDGRAAVISSVGTWRLYNPGNADKWMDAKPSRNDPPVQLGDPNYLSIPESAGWGPEPLWGLREDGSYMYHVVTLGELNDLVPPPPDSTKAPRPKSVSGVVHLCANLTCDLAINGAPFAAARSDGKSFPTTIASGDLLTATALDIKYERGFLLVFISDNGKVTFSTNTSTWRCYTPAEPTRWFRVRPQPDNPAPSKGDLRYLKPDVALDSIFAEPLWDREKSKSLCFFYHVVTPAELKQSR
jgi:hypothetical protein